MLKDMEARHKKELEEINSKLESLFICIIQPYLTSVHFSHQSLGAYSDIV